MSRYKLTIGTKHGTAFEQLVELPDIPEQREAFLMSLRERAKKTGWLTLQSERLHMTVRNDAIAHMVLDKIIMAPPITPEAKADLEKIPFPVPTTPIEGSPIVEGAPE